MSSYGWNLGDSKTIAKISQIHRGNPQPSLFGVITHILGLKTHRFFLVLGSKKGKYDPI